MRYREFESHRVTGSVEFVEARRPHAPATSAARVPGNGLLNRTFESWAERYEVQLLRGLPKSQRLCSSNGKSKRLISARLVVQLHPQPPNYFRHREAQKHKMSSMCFLCLFVAGKFSFVA
jgi:hypothetical protein